MLRAPRGRSSRATRIVRPAVALLGSLLILAAPMVVSAHAELATMTPADKSTSQGSPSQIVATFTEALDPSASSLKIVDASNQVIVEGSVVASDQQTMTLAIPTPLAPGAYTVRWTSKSAADGDLDHGTTSFAVAAAPSASPTPPASASAEPSGAPSVAPTIAPSVAPSPSAAPTTPATSTSDVLIPIGAALIVLAAGGAWLLRGRARVGR